MENPIRKLRESMGMSRNKFARTIGTNAFHLQNAEEKGIKTPEKIVCKIGLTFDVDEGKLLNSYKEWENESRD